MNLSKKIYDCRKKAGLSQDALAEQIGVSRQAVSKWETGEATPEVNKLLLLAQAFHVTTDWLLSETDDPYQPPVPEAPAAPAPAPQQSADTWVDRVPGVMGRMLRRFGWIYGVFVTVLGALFLAFGALIRSIFGQFVGQMNGMNDGVYVDGIGYLDPATGQLASNAANPGTAIGGFVMDVGGVFLVAGLILTVYLLYKRNQK